MKRCKINQLIRSASTIVFGMLMLSIISPAQTKEIFGYSVQQRPLTAYIFGDGENVTMILGAFHNNEPASAAVVESFRHYLETHRTEWAGRKVILVPVTNPDNQGSGLRVNARGVDLNRNFPATWQPAATAVRYNPGPAPASEPETRAVIRLVAKYSPDKIVSIHQPFNCLNWNGEGGRILAKAMSLYNGYPTTSDIGYPTPGSFGTYIEKKGISMVTLEMPSTDAATCWRQNRDALLAAIRLEVKESAGSTT